ncbi:hypothetical protein [Flavobacterium sp. ACAM 123]|uniref:hypothetical protein n=1 Tax=Flavobacterium sp. ACAM 123 TaxID=1189620 RepID=UPI000309D32B|nr:hypothetical protein [Flavobacterium sp. ACAM 123]
MKAYLNVIILFFGLTTLPYSQTKNTGPLSMKKFSAVVMKSIGDDFAVYLPDRNTDPKVKALHNNFITCDLVLNYEGYETYLAYMEIKGRSLATTYNENGKLLRVIENYKDVILPSKVISEIYKKFPGWEIVNDKYVYSQNEGDIIKKQYNLKIKKGNESRKLTVHPNGEIITQN